MLSTRTGPANRVVKHMYLTSGCHTVQVHVGRLGTSKRAVVVGAAPSIDAFESDVGRERWSAWTKGAVGYAATGAIIKNGVEVGYGKPYGEGDLVSMRVDMNQRRLAFFLNDEEQGELADDHSFAASAMFPAITYLPGVDELDIYLL
ncbi:hypothetical protein Poli38472_014072 [Pythium oligandrum]|uniref:B30.2/SPRY domain-containing protein n=1 Tax=Pythium oligandrum TaxID=41045 RepID=A0A8K1CNU1_PYTOL|nr:hypothetical protein Poli38472_014072 [Pythium oligandrum]|eukprot:TMW66760.1 hypothetical protein Poli38472_014072 [Pythium oligandrum]